MCLWLFNDSLKCTCKYCVDGSICDFKFSKVVLAHLGEMGMLCTVLLNVYSRTRLPIFIEIGLYFDMHRTKNKLSRFIETQRICMTQVTHLVGHVCVCVCKTSFLSVFKNSAVYTNVLYYFHKIYHYQSVLNVFLVDNECLGTLYCRLTCSYGS